MITDCLEQFATSSRNFRATKYRIATYKCSEMHENFQIRPSEWKSKFNKRETSIQVQQRIDLGARRATLASHDVPQCHQGGIKIEIKRICARSRPINNFVEEEKEKERERERERDRAGSSVFSCNLLCNACFNCSGSVESLTGEKRMATPRAQSPRSLRSIFPG